MALRPALTPQIWEVRLTLRDLTNAERCVVPVPGGSLTAALSGGIATYRPVQPSRGFLIVGLLLLVFAIASGIPSYFLDCSSPGFVVCGPMSLTAFQVRDSIAIVGVLSIAVFFGLRPDSGHADADAKAFARSVSSGPTVPRTQRLPRKHAVVISVLTGLALCSALALIPVPQPFVMFNTAVYDLEPACGGIDTQAGTVVSFHWTAAASTTLLILNCSSQWYIAQSGTSGSGSFVSSGGIYEFGAGCPEGPCVTIDVQGRYVGPVMPIL